MQLVAHRIARLGGRKEDQRIRQPVIADGETVEAVDLGRAAGIAHEQVSRLTEGVVGRAGALREAREIDAGVGPSGRRDVERRRSRADEIDAIEAPLRAESVLCGIERDGELRGLAGEHDVRRGRRQHRDGEVQDDAAASAGVRAGGDEVSRAGDDGNRHATLHGAVGVIVLRHEGEVGERRAGIDRERGVVAGGAKGVDGREAADDGRPPIPERGRRGAGAEMVGFPVLAGGDEIRRRGGAADAGELRGGGEVVVRRRSGDGERDGVRADRAVRVRDGDGVVAGIVKGDPSQGQRRSRLAAERRVVEIPLEGQPRARSDDREGGGAARGHRLRHRLRGDRQRRAAEAAANGAVVGVGDVKDAVAVDGDLSRIIDPRRRTGAVGATLAVDSTRERGDRTGRRHPTDDVARFCRVEVLSRRIEDDTA